MKYITIFMLWVGFVYGQVSFERILDLDLNKLPEKVRIENCGIYAISNFLVKNNQTYFRYYNSEIFYTIEENRTNKIDLQHLPLTDECKQILGNNNEQISLCSYGPNVYFGKDGYYKDNAGSFISIIVNDEGNLYLDDSQNSNKIFLANENFAFADFIGKDDNNKYYIITERITNHIPLSVERNIYVLNEIGEIINKIKVPIYKYLTVINEFFLDRQGNLYHFLSDSEKCTILKISGLASSKNSNDKYPEEFNKHLHFDQFTTKDEFVFDESKINNTKMAISRNAALRTADTYVSYKFVCKSQNLAPNGITGPDGDIIKTPAYLKVGWNAKIPYMWGGFSTLSDFFSGLNYLNYYAGDIHTTGVSNYAVGVDCSGFVSRCWQLSYHASTAYMPNITTQLSDWTKIKPGDAILKPGHVRLFVNRAQNGALRIAEASSRDWAVSYWSFAISDLGSYTPNKYNQMETDFNETLINLYCSVKQQNKVRLVWKSDTTNIKGYRLYRSVNGKNWSVLLDENNLTSSESLIDIPTEPTFYKVTIIKNSLNGLLESNFSNTVGVSPVKNNKNYLIVDGFNRNIGSASFQGIFNPYPIAYGLGLKSSGAAFDIVKNTYLKLDTLNLNNYYGIFWYVGDESSGDESFDDFEQILLKNYLENGGKLFICGSEIGYDLEEKGSATDKDFYANYLKAKYMADNASSNIVKTTAYSVFDSLQFSIGQTYAEDYPDVINPLNGSINCFNYINGKSAGIMYEGIFGNSIKPGKLVYLSFPLETTADDTSFNKTIRNIKYFFENPLTQVENELENNLGFRIENAYPNPFNASTNLSFSLNERANVEIIIYNILGQQVSILHNGELEIGKYNIKFENNQLSTGIYIANFKINNKIYNLKLSLIK